jgi:hypothetical protein
MPTADDAIAAARRGWSVFPVAAMGKRPLVAWRELSTTDEDAISAWWSEHPDANIGLDCGKSGVVVIDVDDMDAIPILTERLGWNPADDRTSIARTGRGGLHIYYRAGGNSVRNSASKVVRGVDIRGDGGYVVLPPSVHESSQVYHWISESDILPIPEKLVEVLSYREEPQSVPTFPIKTHERWGMAVLASEAHAVESSQPGTRNETLNRSSWKVFGVVKGGNLDYEIARMRMHQAGIHVGLSPEEVDRTLASAWEGAEAFYPDDLREPVTRPQAEDQPRRSFRALTLEDLENLPPPTWLLDQRIPEGLTFIYGEPGSGKTFLALDWAASVASKGLNVIYFVGEGVTGFARRVSAWHNVYRKDINTLLVVPQAPHLLERESVSMLRETVEQHSPSLIIIDTFARASVGGDENSARDVGLAIDSLDALWKDYKTSSLVIHHSNKAGAGERGSSAIRGAADATWEVKPGIDGDRYVGSEVVCRKMKDSEPPRSFFFQLRGHADSAYVFPGAS